MRVVSLSRRWPRSAMTGLACWSPAMAPPKGLSGKQTGTASALCAIPPGVRGSQDWIGRSLLS
jgi:hypothetical protein